jgi:hypothetical protein
MMHFLSDIEETENELTAISDLMNDLGWYPFFPSCPLRIFSLHPPPGMEVKTQGEHLDMIEEVMNEAEEETTLAITELEKAPCCATCGCCRCWRSIFCCCNC